MCYVVCEAWAEKHKSGLHVSSFRPEKQFNETVSCSCANANDEGEGEKERIIVKYVCVCLCIVCGGRDELRA